MDTELLVTEACSDASSSDGENSDPWNLPHVITITSSSESEEVRHDDRQAVSTNSIIASCFNGLFYFEHISSACKSCNVLCGTVHTVHCNCMNYVIVAS